jgi:hypothetical protein
VIDIASLARRAVACKGWRWMPGMLTTQSERVVCANSDYWGARLWVSLLGSDSAGGVFVRSFCDSSGSCLPELTDPATLGCLLALVREAYADARITVVPRGARVWAVVYPGWLHMKAIAMGKTEAEALIAALESAP